MDKLDQVDMTIWPGLGK
jgi:hypothetical protein